MATLPRGASPRLIAFVCLFSAVVAPLAASCVSKPDCACDAAILKLPPDQVTRGQPATYSLLVNYGGHELCDDGQLCVTDTLPPELSCDPADFTGGTSPDWTCTCSTTSVRCCYASSLPDAPGLLPAINVPVHVAESATQSVKNCAAIDQGFQGSFEDSNATNNSSCVESKVVAPTVVTPTVDLGVEKSHSEPMVYGQIGVFHIHISNNGDSPVSVFSVVDVLPVGLTFHHAEPSSLWACTATPPAPMTQQTVTCDFVSGTGGLPPSTSTLLDLYVLLDGPEDELLGAKLQNCASLDGVKGDISASNDASCDGFVVEGGLPCTKWSKWVDRDNPSSTGDWETIPQSFGQPPCPVTPKNPSGAATGIECRAVDGTPWSVTYAADPTVTCSLPSGLICQNALEAAAQSKACDYDYEVRICCP